MGPQGQSKDLKVKVKVKISKSWHFKLLLHEKYGKFGLLVQLVFQRHQFQHFGSSGYGEIVVFVLTGASILAKVGKKDVSGHDAKTACPIVLSKILAFST